MTKTRKEIRKVIGEAAAALGLPTLPGGWIEAGAPRTEGFMPYAVGPDGQRYRLRHCVAVHVLAGQGRVAVCRDGELVRPKVEATVDDVSLSPDDSPAPWEAPHLIYDATSHALVLWHPTIP